MEVRVRGAKETKRVIEKILENLEKVELITSELDRLMRDYVHIVTGYLQSTIYHKANIAGAEAPYAGYEEERGHSHAYATMAIEAFNESDYLDRLIEGF